MTGQSSSQAATPIQWWKPALFFLVVIAGLWYGVEFYSKLIVTMEEHMINGGLGSAVSEYLVTQKKHPVQMFVGIRDGYPKTRDIRILL